jgi:acyl transferase domain-containing protein
VIIEEAPDTEQTEAPGGTGPERNAGPVSWVVSASSPAALRAQAAQLVAAVAGNPVREVARSLAVTRSHLRQRAAVTGADSAELRRGLLALAEDRDDPALVRGQARPGEGTAFLFTGQGSQRLGMGRALAGRFPVFAEWFDTVTAELDRHLSAPLREVVWGSKRDRLDRTGFTQPAVFAVEVALFRLLESWGVRPGFLAGHSIGELAAAYVAGVWSLPEACRLVAARGRLMDRLPPGGAMLAIQAAESEVAPLLTGEVSIAAVNGPAAVVVSGAEPAVTALARRLAAEGRRTSRLPVSHAFHSPLMEPMLAEFGEVVAGLTFAAPQLAVVSGVTGRLAVTGELGAPEYWVRQVRETVRFRDSVRYLEAERVTRFVELGPDAALAAMIAENLRGDRPAAVIALLRRDRDEVGTLTEALANIHVNGATVDWPAVLGPEPAGHLELPTYPFQRKRFWMDAPAVAAAGAVAGAGQLPAGHPLLGAAVALSDSGGMVVTGRVSVRAHPWLALCSAHRLRWVVPVRRWRVVAG